MAYKIFISHCHDDKCIADVIREHLEYWGFDKQDIFQSSYCKGGGPGVGESIKESIKKALSEVSLVILIYTFKERDWSYPMWECGLATDPMDSEMKIFAVQCTADEPKVYRDYLRMDAREMDSVRKYVMQVHKQDRICLEGMEALTNVQDVAIERRASDLFNELQNVVPSGKMVKKFRWGYFTLKVEAELVERIKEESPAGEDVKAKLLSELVENCSLIRAEGWAINHFGFNEFDENLTLKTLEERWENHVKELTNVTEPGKEWLDDLCLELLRAINNESPKISWSYLKSVRPDIDWYVTPVVNQFRKLPEGGIEFDVFMYKVNPNKE